MKLFALLYLVYSAYCATVNHTQCGRLNIDQVYNESQVAEFGEFPWIARVLFNDGRQDKVDELQFMCNAVLISEAHLLAPASCFAQNSLKAEVVILGDSNYGNSENASDCKAEMCTPAPKLYQINDIAIHPNFDGHKLIYNIAIIHLTERVEYSDYIQPICLPPPFAYINDISAQYLTYAGFTNDYQYTEKLKTVAHIIPLDECNQKIHFKIPATNYCASYVGSTKFLSGSVIMSVNIVDGKLKNYYLVGLVCYSTVSKVTVIDVFEKVSSYTNWIHSNINSKFSKTPPVIDDCINTATNGCVENERIWN